MFVRSNCCALSPQDVATAVLAPAANEGADGVLEGQGEGAALAPYAVDHTTPAVPVSAADEGRDGVLEGQYEGAFSKLSQTLSFEQRSMSTEPAAHCYQRIETPTTCGGVLGHDVGNMAWCPAIMTQPTAHSRL